MSGQRPRIRELGIKIGNLPVGPLNAITDISGIKVGQATLIEGSGKLLPGKGPVRTGVTVVFPHEGDLYLDRVLGAVEWFNGFGECLGSAVVNEFGFIMGPIVLTNSFNVYKVADALQDWSMGRHPEIANDYSGLICLVAECADDYLNDAQGRHVHREHVFGAIESASCGMPEEGSVGGGTGDIVFGFKGGIGTASRIVPEELGGYTIGTLVQANFGIRENLIISGVPIGRELRDWQPDLQARKDDGSCVMVVGTNAPLSSRQLHRVARRAFLGMARTGGVGRNGSGDVAIAFSTAHRIPRDSQTLTEKFNFIPDFREDTINALFQATTDVIEEAILNSMFASDTMAGRDNHIALGLPIAEVKHIMHKYGHILTDG